MFLGISFESIAQESAGTVTDIDGNEYKTVRISDQIWMTENLKVTHYQNGDSIPNVTDNAKWTNLTTGAYCDYKNDINNSMIYGRLYNWYTVKDSRNVCPEGWHVPSDTAFIILQKSLGGRFVAGGRMKEAGEAHWAKKNYRANNNSGFTSLPSGFRGSTTGIFGEMGQAGSFWTTTSVSTWGARAFSLVYNLGDLQKNDMYREIGYSIRCLKD